MNQKPYLFAAFAIAMMPQMALGDFVYNDFSSVSGLQLNGTAAQVGNLLRLTPISNFAGGSAFTTDQTPLGAFNSFSTYFRFQMTGATGLGDEDGPGADGLVFVLQTVSNSVGGSGGGIGYQGITPSLGIEFDTFNNGSGFGDPNGNHVGIDLNGNIVSIVTATEPVRFNNGQVWNAWIDYNGVTNGLEVRWSLNSARPSAPQLSSTVNVQQLFGQNTGFVGFTAATGNGLETHDILNWEFRDSYNPVVPEPSSLFLAVLGGSLLAMSLRRQQRLGYSPDTKRA